MSYKLVIVESPAKAKTIEKYLPDDCKVTATMGHVIDLPASKLGIDIENHYQPEYKPITGKAKLLKEIKQQTKGADEVILATDPDREGEAISFHLANYLGLDLNQNNRIEFHEITPAAIGEAMLHKRPVDMNVVDAQQARRVLDRLVGYKISPILWKKVMRGLSAGRVQSVATRIIVDRENEIRNFISEEYWNIIAKLKQHNDDTVFDAYLLNISGKKAEVKNEEQSTKIVSDLKSGNFIVEKVKQSTKRRKAAPPFTTSTLQQDANRKLSYSSKKTMMIAQQLYEGLEIMGKGHIGLVTYIRTDSIRIAEPAQEAAKSYITETYGKEYIGGTAAKAKKAVKIQDAHEAIRPTDLLLTPDNVKDSLTKDQLKLYTLIYRRFLASMMSDAMYDTLSADIQNGIYTMRTTGSKLKFPGFLKVYDTDETEQESTMPLLTEKESLILKECTGEQKFTQPPPRYTEATLVKALEEKGIGRPSTYAPTISTILARNYVVLEEKKFSPTDLGEAVTTLMKDNFSEVVDIGFTADMEDNLDKVALGEDDWVEVIDDFYKRLQIDLEKAESIERIKLPEEVTDVKCEKCGKNMVVKHGRFGKFLACPGYPECSFTMPLTEKVDAHCPECGSEIVVRKTKKGKTFYGCKSYPECNFMSWSKPTDEKCPECGKPLFLANGKSEKKFCADKTCGYKEE